MIDSGTIELVWKAVLLVMAIGALGGIVWLGLFLKGWVSLK